MKSKAEILFINERLNPGSLVAYLRTIPDPKEKLALSVYVYTLFNIIDKKYKGPLRTGID